jgi:hypothetical protein
MNFYIVVKYMGKCGCGDIKIFYNMAAIAVVDRNLKSC